MLRHCNRHEIARPSPPNHQAFYAFGIGGFVTILGYVYVETDHALLHRLMTQTRFGKIVLQATWACFYLRPRGEMYGGPNIHHLHAFTTCNDRSILIQSNVTIYMRHVCV